MVSDFSKSLWNFIQQLQILTLLVAVQIDDLIQVHRDRVVPVQAAETNTHTCTRDIKALVQDSVSAARFTLDAVCVGSTTFCGHFNIQLCHPNKTHLLCFQCEVGLKRI